MYGLCAGLGGTFGGQSVTLAKSTIELIKSSFSGGDAFTHLASYIIVFSMAVSTSALLVLCWCSADALTVCSCSGSTRSSA